MATIINMISANNEQMQQNQVFPPAANHAIAQEANKEGIPPDLLSKKYPYNGIFLTYLRIDSFQKPLS